MSVRKRLYDYDGNPRSGLFEIVCDGCGKHLEVFMFAEQDLCLACRTAAMAGGKR